MAVSQFDEVVLVPVQSLDQLSPEIGDIAYFWHWVRWDHDIRGVLNNPETVDDIRIERNLHFNCV